MQIRAIKTDKVLPHDSLEILLDKALPSLEEETIIAITSKIVSLCEGRIVNIADVPDKKQLVHQEADAYLDTDIPSKYGISLTIKNDLLIPTAGIDESNGQDIYILYPENIPQSAARIWDYLRRRHRLKKLGVLITDSTTTPLRYGVTGIGIGWCGFAPLHSYIGQPDCFGRPLRVTKINILDALAASAVFVMGEGAEQTPIAVIQGAPYIDFADHPPTKEDLASVTIDLENDLYAPILTAAKWIRKQTS